MDNITIENIKINIELLVFGLNYKYGYISSIFIYQNAEVLKINIDKFSDVFKQL